MHLSFYKLCSLCEFEGDNYLSEDDILGFEDESQRIECSGITAEKIRSILTGEVVAVYGRVIDSGTFEIEDWVRRGSRALKMQF